MVNLKAISFTIFLLSTMLFMMGLIMIYSTTSAEVLDMDLLKSTHGAVQRQLLYGLMGTFLGAVLWKFGYRTLLETSPYLLLIFTVLLLLTLIPGIGREVNGSKRWLMIFGLSLQPSEFVKYIIPAYFIYQVSKVSGNTLNFKEFLKIVATVALPMLLITIEPNNGTTAVIAMSILVLCLLMKVSFKYWAIPLLVFVIFGSIFAYNLSYVSARVKVYMNPELDLKGKGHQPHQAKIAVGSGGFFGRGPGNSMQKLSYLPEAQNDYIAAIFAEEFGFLGMFLLIFIYMTIALLGFYIASQVQDINGFYYASVITFLLAFQSFLNLGVVSGLLPSTGLNLPLFSQGGSSLMANIFGLSILFNIANGEAKE